MDSTGHAAPVSVQLRFLTRDCPMVHLADLWSRFIRLSPAGQGVTPKVPDSGLQCPARVDTKDHGVCRPGGMSESTLDTDPFHTDQTNRRTVSPDVLAFWGAAPPITGSQRQWSLWKMTARWQHSLSPRHSHHLLRFPQRAEPPNHGIHEDLRELGVPWGSSWTP